MSFRLIVTEKPSVAADIAKIVNAVKKGDYYEGGGYKITWCLGHLVEYCTPDQYVEEYKKWDINTLPIIPDAFKTSVIEKTKKQFNVVKKLMNDESVTEIICATDAGREGEAIFRLTYYKAGCKKPFKRLWISSMTDEAIKAGLENMKDGKEYDSLYESARCRAIADWLIGINATRLYTVKHGIKLTAGRVQTPTLALLVKRHFEILNFKPEPYYQLKGDFGYFTALWYSKEGETRIKSKEEAEAIQNKCQGKIGKVTKLESKEKSIERPLLFDLTELQREGNRRYGLTAQQVLNIAQSLYETHKITTYPRTDSRYITDDMVPTLRPLLENMKKNDKFNMSEQISILLSKGLNIDKRIVDNSKVSDHHAIIPTANIGSYDLSKLNENEKKILKLILTRLIVTLSDKHIYNETTLTVDVSGEIFKASGKKTITPGWKGVEDAILGKEVEEKEQQEDTNNQIFPDVKQGQEYKVKDVLILSKKTQPKKPFTEATLLTAMENAGDEIEDDALKEQMKDKGLGTPATRAGIIEHLIKVGYVDRKGKKLEPTDTGIKFIEIVDDKIKQPALTAEWEYRLNLIETGKEKSEKFINDIKTFTKDLVSKYKEKPGEQTFILKQEKEVIGLCPRCGKNVYEGEKNFYCSGYKDNNCEFKLWKQDKFFVDRGKTITASIAKKMLRNGKVEMKKLKSKKGNEYNAIFIMKDTGKYVNFEMEFLNDKK